jgi:hypothetical protein
MPSIDQTSYPPYIIDLINQQSEQELCDSMIVDDGGSWGIITTSGNRSQGTPL